MDIAGYLHDVRRLYDSGQTTEHSFRPALERLFASVDDDLTVINEPTRLTDVGAPDFVFNRNGISVGWCEAKDLGTDITKFGKGDYSKEQKERYSKGLPNLIYTNGADFQFIKQGEVVGFVSIADFIPMLPAIPENFAALEHKHPYHRIFQPSHLPRCGGFSLSLGIRRPESCFNLGTSDENFPSLFNRGQVAITD